MEVTVARDAEGIAWIRAAAGPFGPARLAELDTTVVACLDDAAVTGVVLAAGPGAFFGELDLPWLHAATADEIATFAGRAARLAQRIDEASKPVAAAITASARGVGLELALACHRRFGAAGAGYVVGFTDLRLGLPPLMATAPRLARRMGTEAASRVLRDAQPLTPASAHKAGLIDELAPATAVAARARRWVLETAAQRRQKPAEAVIARSLAPTTTPDAVDAATRAYVEVATGPVARDMVRTLGLSVAAADRLDSRPLGVAPRSYRRAGVLGAGLMGSGIALVAARAGMEVVLVDVTAEAARRGFDALARQEASAVAAGRVDAAVSQMTLARIHPTARYEDLSGVDIVVEAVFEDREVKAKVTRRAEDCAGAQALFATNTSTLPITGLAQASARPRQFIGLHFFSPVPRMPLLEIIRGEQTSEETLAHAMDFARAIGKTPIVVNDARGFYTTRIVMAYQAEAFDMLAQGADPEVIEAGGIAAGMPLPPLALSDAVALDLIHQINLQAARDLGDAYVWTPGYAMVGRLVEQEGRKGKKTGHGFYDHADDGKPDKTDKTDKTVWPRLREFAAGGVTIEMSVADARDRLLAAQALETVRCLAEGVIVDPSQCDVGAILGWGFAPWTGGPLSWIDRMGVRECVRRCKELAARYASARLEPPAVLEALAARGISVYKASWPGVAGH